EQQSNEESNNIYNAIEGRVIPLDDVNDEVFSSRMMGDGFAIIPENSHVYAPFDGTVITIFETKHAIGLISDVGVEILIHMGINTVELKGKYFDIKIKQGDAIKKGQLIAEVNWDGIKGENYDTTTPIIVTNSKDYDSIQLNSSE